MSSSQRDVCIGDVYIGNDHYIISGTGKLVLGTKRASPRDFVKDESKFEKEFLEKNVKSFEERKSTAYKWLAVIYDSAGNVNKVNAITVASIVSFVCHLLVPRESYRRFKSIIYWLEEHLSDAYYVFTCYPVIIRWFDCQKVFRVTPPPLYSLNEEPQGQAAITQLQPESVNERTIPQEQTASEPEPLIDPQESSSEPEPLFEPQESFFEQPSLVIEPTRPQEQTAFEQPQEVSTTVLEENVFFPLDQSFDPIDFIDLSWLAHVKLES